MAFKFDKNRWGHIVDLFNLDIPRGLKNEFWQDLTIACFDIETTGLNYENPSEFRITQFAAATYQKADYQESEKIDEINIRINPEIKTPNEVIEITGIYNSELDKPATIEKHGKFDTSDCPTWHEVIDEIEKFMFGKCDLWAAYNHAFDVNGLASEMFRYQRRKDLDYEFNWRPTIDPMHFHRRLKDKSKNASLWNLAKDYGAAYAANVMSGDGDLHEAQTDIILLNEVMWKMSNGLPPTVANLFDKQLYLLEQHLIADEKQFG